MFDSFTIAAILVVAFIGFIVCRAYKLCRHC